MLPSLPVSASNARRNEASVFFSGVVPALAEAVGLGPPRPEGGIGTGLRVIDADHRAPLPAVNPIALVAWFLTSCASPPPSRRGPMT